MFSLNMWKQSILALILLFNVCKQNEIKFPKESNTTFNLFTLKNKEKQIILDFDANDTSIESSGFNPKLKTILIVHGWTSGYYKSNLFKRLWMKDMTDYILAQMDSNVICVDWSKLASSLDYIAVLPNVPLTGQMIAHFINRLINVTKISTNDIQCIGHSLGAHVCSFVGKAFPSNKLSQITGLDPAWPGFVNKSPKTRLDPSDANLVIVEHTSSGVIASGDFNIDGFVGNPDSLGHYDFRINGGNKQPLCKATDQTLDALKDVRNFQLSKAESALEFVGFCPHETAYIYPIMKPENGCKFIAYQCSNYGDFKIGKCVETGQPIPLNLDFYGKPNNKLNETKPPNNLFIETSNSYPYCLFHYQIVVELDNKLTADEKIKISLNGTKPVEFDMMLFFKDNQKNHTYLYTNKEELGPVTNALATVTQSAQINSISINYLGDLSERIRKEKSFSTKVKTRQVSSKNGGHHILHLLEKVF